MRWLGILSFGAGAARAAEFWPAHPTHDFVNIDPQAPFPEPGLMPPGNEELRWSVFGAGGDLVILTLPGTSVAVGDAHSRALRCSLDVPYLPRCQPPVAAEGRVWLLREPGAAAASFSELFEQAVLNIGWRQLQLAMDQYNSTTHRVQWTSATRSDLDTLWRSLLNATATLTQLSYLAHKQLEEVGVRHCLFSWHSLLLPPGASSGAAPGAAGGALTVTANSTALRLTAFARPAASACPSALYSASDPALEAAYQQHVDSADDRALLKQVRVHTQWALATVRTVAQNFKSRGVLRRLYGLHRLADAALAEHRPLGEWYEASLRILRPEQTDELAHLVNHNWAPVYTGRVPAGVLRRSPTMTEHITRAMIDLRIEPFREPVNGYHSIVGFGVGEAADACGGGAAARRAVIVKVPMPTTTTHLNDWLTNWLREKASAERVCALPRALTALLARPLRVEGQPRFVALEEFVEGRNLRELLIHDLRADQVGSVLADVIGQIMPLWQAGYNHNDLALGNIMIRPDGAVKLIDVGAVAKSTRFRDGRFLDHLRALLEKLGHPLAAVVPRLEAEPARDTALKMHADVAKAFRQSQLLPQP